MKAYIKERTLEVAHYILATGDTIRSTAKIFRISKSTVHNDVSKRLKKLDGKTYEKVREILDLNFSEKHIRGGVATKQKYADARERELWKTQLWKMQKCGCENDSKHKKADEKATAKIFKKQKLKNKKNKK